MLLHLCAEYDAKECLFLLISKGVDIDCLDANNCTPLILAIEKNNMKIIKNLIELGANRESK